MPEDYEIARGGSKYGPKPRTDEDCPQRAKFLKELDIRKGREPFTWRKTLGYKAQDGRKD